MKSLLFPTIVGVAAGLVQEGHVLTRGMKHKLWYRAHNAEFLHDKPPLIVCHGGPQVPSDYLFDLAELDNDRCIVFYDQLGCGRSETADADSGAYGIEKSVDDLRQLLSCLSVEAFHLYGQSWGGLLAFEHLVQDADDTGRRALAAPLTLTLSNTPTSVPMVEAEAGRFIQDECEGDVDAFMSKHNCRLEEKPASLDAAYAHAGTTWRGTSAINGYEIDQDLAKSRVLCPALCLRGEYDFVTEACVEGWKAIPTIEFATLEGCSHHALLEQPKAYLGTLDAFLRKHDPQ